MPLFSFCGMLCRIPTANQWYYSSGCTFKYLFLKQFFGLLTSGRSLGMDSRIIFGAPVYRSMYHYTVEGEIVRRWRWRLKYLKPPLALIFRKDPCPWRFIRNWKRHLRGVRSEKALVPPMLSSQERTAHRTWRSGASVILGRATRNATSLAHVRNDRLSGI